MTPTTLPITHLSFIIPEVHCLHCTQSIERHLIKKSYVHAAQVNLTQKKLYIQVDPKIDSETIVDNLSDIGFSANPAHQFSTSDENKIRSQQLLMRIGVASFALMNV
ncbi:MAG: heavy metal-associated domain-containing protein, partial [Burkholderiales bacterium]|nr:heavy metal-associated domain-containing protein [Burkholderiales bacterium]